jgi:ureidoglycolate hydrolase
MALKVVELSDEALAGIGRVLSPAVPVGTRIAKGEGFSYDVVFSDIGLGASPSAGCLDCAVRPMRLEKMERHLKTVELLSAVEGDSIVCVAPPQESSAGSLTGIKAIRVRKGQSFVLDTGAWHWIPFPEGKKPSRFLVVFRSLTGSDDLGFCDFAKPMDIG